MFKITLNSASVVKIGCGACVVGGAYQWLQPPEGFRCRRLLPMPVNHRGDGRLSPEQIKQNLMSDYTETMSFSLFIDWGLKQKPQFSCMFYQITAQGPTQISGPLRNKTKLFLLLIYFNNKMTNCRQRACHPELRLSYLVEVVMWSCGWVELRSVACFQHFLCVSSVSPDCAS